MIQDLRPHLALPPLLLLGIAQHDDACIVQHVVNILQVDNLLFKQFLFPLIGIIQFSTLTAWVPVIN
jgi:hypothetical protein